MIFIIIRFQTSFDDFHPKKDRLYRVLTASYHAGAATTSYASNVPFPMPKALETSFPEIEQIAPVYASHNDELQVTNSNGTVLKNFKEQSGVFYTTPSFFDMFHFPLLEGSYASLKEPNHVLLTKEIAETYFGDWKTAMGKTINIRGYYSMGAGLFQFPATTLKISGILATIPANTDFQLKLVVAYGTDFTGDKEYGFQQPQWTQSSPGFGCYILLPPGIGAEKCNRQLNAWVEKLQSGGNKDSYSVQPLSAVHYDAATGNYSNRTISHELVNVLWLIAALILLIACVNFINLSTAQAINRAKETGVRKVLGSNRFQLQMQFITETFLIVSVAVILSVIITWLALPYVSELLELSLSVNELTGPAVMVFLLATAIIVTLLAGFYPSIVLSRFNPVNALKNRLTIPAASGISLRRALVVFQFVIAQALIIAPLIIAEQMNYFMEQPLGFDKDAIVNVPYRPDSTGDKLTGYLKQQLLSAGAQAVSFNSTTPIEDNVNMFSSFKFDNAIKEADFQAITKFADNDYVPTYRLQLVAGRNLQASGWTKEFLVNESFVKTLGLKKPEDILNKEISILSGLIKCPVVGVLKDFNDRSLRQELAPLLIATNATMYRQASVKLSTKNIPGMLQAIKKIWQQTMPDQVYEYRFLDDKIDGFYKQEHQLSQLYKIFAGIAVLLSCLGLYGLVSFMAVQRVKEVGIRKVLGATAGNIVYLFSKEFLLLIAIAFLVAAPVAWYYMHQWLQGYAYRIDINGWTFFAGGISAIVIALSTIGFRAIKAARANPVKCLRVE